MSLVRDRTSLESLEEHIQKKKNWRDGLLSKLINIQTSISESNSFPHKEGKNNDEDPDRLYLMSDFKAKFFNCLNPAKKIPEDEASVSSSDEIQAIKSPLYGGEKMRKVTPTRYQKPELYLKSASTSPIRTFSAKEEIDKKTPLQFRGLLFSEMPQAAEQNPIYDKQKAKIQKMFLKKRQKTISKFIIASPKSIINLSENEGQSIINNKTRSSTSPLKFHQRVTSRQGRRLSPSTQSPMSLYHTDQNFRRNDNGSYQKGMFRLIHALGLHRVFEDRLTEPVTTKSMLPPNLQISLDSPSPSFGFPYTFPEERRLKSPSLKQKTVPLETSYNGIHVNSQLGGPRMIRVKTVSKI